MKNSKVLVMADWYTPGFKAGGPIRSVVNFADQLEKKLEIFIFTSDRDLGDMASYPNIILDQWILVNQHKVFYASPENLSWSKILSVIKNIHPDVIYLNSMFSRFFTIYPLLMKKLGLIQSTIILAPRGMLKESALQHKRGKKRIFISLLRYLNISGLVQFHATDIREEADIIQVFGRKARLFTIGNLPGKQAQKFSRLNKEKGKLKMIFIGRIHPIKKPDFLLQLLTDIKDPVELDIIATLEDASYWEECKKVIAILPENINVSLIQDLPHNQVADQINQHHLFVLPTMGENYGHAIFESLSQGRPVLISDQTPWKNLEAAGVGWDLPLNEKIKFTEAIRKAISWDQQEFDEHCSAAFNFAAKTNSGEPLIPGYLEKFSQSSLKYTLYL